MMPIHRCLPVLIAGAVALAAPLARADDDEPFAKGTLEYSSSLSFDRSTFSSSEGDVSFSQTHLSAAGGVGWALSERWELGGAVLAQHRALAGEGQNGLGASAGAIVNFERQGNLVPFVSASIGAINYFNSGQNDRVLLLPIVRAGFRSMIRDNVSLNASIGYQHESNPESTFKGSANVFDVGVGASFFQRH